MPGGCLGFLNHQQYDTLPETNNLPLKNDGWKMIFSLFGKGLFSEVVISSTMCVFINEVSSMKWYDSWLCVFKSGIP